jgi:hypothetical protein
MLGAIRRLILYRLLGARIMLGLAIFGWLRRQLGAWQSSRRRLARSSGVDSAYQPSQGSSQIVQREPR